MPNCTDDILWMSVLTEASYYLLYCETRKYCTYSTAEGSTALLQYMHIPVGGAGGGVLLFACFCVK